ncbi:hypothetical protein [Anaerotignum propionicum]|uniref:HNH endonuclease n=1 Tax=Anaerotignum propionicum DSM 1682 TaxID=991789 RepID=A0A0X1U7V1_ANAPI|nr:hypothetical protein [Anaerotignum propionicum]AMJ41011.1 hypothetical protein CPRO_14180 [Anaerotignum propionicum DSM 1682]SHE61265.1 hypothetical protein SAMN02745151_01229 [[Clostridium] propionicum DSM 1682] [Anaerotignum propionicum DSM 1682]
MWKITNNYNMNILKNFDSCIIVPLFNELLHYKKINFKNSIMEYLEQDDLYDIDNRKNLKKLLRLKHDQTSLFIIIDKLLKDISFKRLQRVFFIYKYQNSLINRHIYNVPLFHLPKQIKLIFTDYFYDEFFAKQTIWNIINKSTKSKCFTRAQFHDNFKEENRIHVCPYCDIDTTYNIGNNQVEHFLPKSKYPLLSMNAYNLVSSCIACNSTFEGKSDNLLTPIIAPYTNQIGDLIKFSMEIKTQEIKLESDIKEVNNFITLLNLRKRYSNKNVYENVFIKGETLYSTILSNKALGNDMSEEEIKDYIKNMSFLKPKYDPMYFAITYIYSDYDKYKEFVAENIT